MVFPKIEQVTTRSKGKQSEWEVQDDVRKAAKEWVEEANKLAEETVVLLKRKQHVDPSGSVPLQEHEETWKILAGCEVSLPLTRLLKLVPWFTEKVARLIAQKDVE